MPGPAGGARPPHGASRVVPAIPHALAPKLRQSQHPSNLHPPPSTASTGHFAGKEDVPVTLTEQAPNGSVTPTPEAAATQDHAGVQSDDGAASLAVEAHTFSHPSADDLPITLGPSNPAVNVHKLPTSVTTPSHSSTRSSSESVPVPPNDFRVSPAGQLPRSREGFTYGEHYMIHGVASPRRLHKPEAEAVEGSSTISSNHGPHPGAPPFVPNGHAYHYSEPFAGSVPNPPFFPHAFVPREMLPHARSEFPDSRPTHPPGNRPQYGHFRAGENVFSGPGSTSYVRPYQARHLAPVPPRSQQDLNFPAQSELTKRYREPHADAGESGPFYQYSHSTHHPLAASDGHGDQDSGFDSAASTGLGRFLHDQFGNPRFADVLLRFSHSANRFVADTVPCHSVVLARSPQLISLMAMQDKNPGQYEGSPKTLHVVLSDRFISNMNAFARALYRLYAEPLPTLNEMSDGGGIYFALSFAAAGHFLQFDEIVRSGLDLVIGQLRWDTVTKAMAFALDGGLGSSWAQKDSSNEEVDGSSSFDETPSKMESPISAPTYGLYSEYLLQAVIHFLVRSCPVDAKFLPGVPQLADSPRLPVEAEHRHTRSDSRLCRIRFGEMTIEDERPPPDPVNTTWSSILLSLPFPVLKHMLEHKVMIDRFGSTKLVELMRSVVEEREQRRQRVSKGHAVSAPESSIAERLWQNVRWAEAVENSQQHPTGLKLTRNLLGVETPTSTASGSNKS